jgi:hypothetical protein
MACHAPQIWQAIFFHLISAGTTMKSPIAFVDAICIVFLIIMSQTHIDKNGVTLNAVSQ